MKGEAGLGGSLKPYVDSGRIVASYGADEGGLTLVVCAALHGNEPAGVDVSVRVIDRLRSQGLSLPGRLIGMVGNLGAFKRNRRFLDRDLNRRWQDARIDSLGSRTSWERCREDNEQLELRTLFEEVIGLSDDVVFMDLHTTSGQAPAFSVIIDQPQNRVLAASIGNPIVVDFENYTDGPILGWWHERGFRTVGVEGGLHTAPGTIGRLEHAVWSVIQQLGWVSEGAEQPHVGVESPAAILRIVYRHRVVPGMGFRMEPGFKSFEAVQRGQIVAHDRTGFVRSPFDGLMFLPLYQDQGADGFFIIQYAD